MLKSSECPVWYFFSQLTTTVSHLQKKKKGREPFTAAEIILGIIIHKSVSLIKRYKNVRVTMYRKKWKHSSSLELETSSSQVNKVNF